MTRIWQLRNPESTTTSPSSLADAQLLIADGHHRYETAIAYRDEIGGEGPHNYTLMALTGLDDPGLSVFPPTACSPASPTTPSASAASARACASSST